MWRQPGERASFWQSWDILEPVVPVREQARSASNTVVFSDVAGSTGLGERLALIELYERLLRSLNILLGT